MLFAMLTFSLVMSISPGPVNMIILSSGARYGIRQTFAFVSGATIGFTLLLLGVGLGLDQIISMYPAFLKYLSVFGGLFIIYMGYLIFKSRPDLSIDEAKRPKFFQGFLMQWLNPKAWLACVTSVPLFSKPNDLTPFLIFSLVYFIVCYLSLFTWSFLGSKATLLLNSNQRIKIFNQAMGGLLMVTACFLVFSQFYSQNSL